MTSGREDRSLRGLPPRTIRPATDERRFTPRTGATTIYQILASVVTGQIVNGSTGVRTLALRLPASVAAWNAPGHRLPEPVTPFPTVEISTTPDLKVPYAMHTAVGVDRAIWKDASLSANFIGVVEALARHPQTGKIRCFVSRPSAGERR
jgi:hypothetical protein